MQFRLDSKTVEALQNYSTLLNKSVDTILKEALEEYFVKVEKEILEDTVEKESALTNLSYNEFWDGIDDI